MALCAGISGCTTVFYPEQEPAHAAFESQECATVALNRQRDAAANGYDALEQTQILNGTYADCVKWRSTHGSL